MTTNEMTTVEWDPFNMVFLLPTV